jgi:hypothetical protein
MKNMREHFPESEKSLVTGVLSRLTIPRKLGNQAEFAADSDFLSPRHLLC